MWTWFLFTYRIAKEKEPKEKAVEVRCEDAQVHWGGTGNFNHQWHEAVQAEHTEGKCHEQQGCENMEEIRSQRA